MSPQDWQGRPWAEAAEALFRRAAAMSTVAPEARRGAEAVDPVPENAGVDPMPASAAAPEPPAEPGGEPSPPAQPVMPPEAVAAASPDQTALPAVPSGLRPGRGADPPERYTHLDRSRPEVRALLAEWGYRTD